MKSFFFRSKTKEKKARFTRAPHDNIVFSGPTMYISSCVLRALRCVRLTVFLFFFSKSGVYPCLLAVFWYHKLFAPASDCLRLVLNRQARLPTLDSRNSTTNSSSTHQPTAALQIDQSLYHTLKLCRQPGFTACSARESTTTEITGPKLIGCTGTSTTLQKVKKRQLWLQPFELLKLNFASGVVHQTRSYNMVFVNSTYDMIINNQFNTKYRPIKPCWSDRWLV